MYNLLGWAACRWSALRTIASQATEVGLWLASCQACQGIDHAKRQHSLSIHTEIAMEADIIIIDPTIIRHEMNQLFLFYFFHFLLFIENV